VTVRAAVYLGPIATSIAFVHYAGKVVSAPLSSLWLYLAWWFGLSLAATGVLVALDRMMRRLLPLAALLQLSLVFPDEAPSRFRVAFKAGDVDRLEARLAAKKAAAAATTPSEAAERLLELVAALNIHDPLTRGHCDRVRAYSVMIGEELGLSRDELDLLNWAALLHDVGKLEVPTEILAKDGRPSDAEWQVLRRHPLEGETLVEPMRSWLGTWTSAVGFHHERWDGKGYPRGLAGEEIPLPGRIVAVADVFDVITSARSYKKASAAEEGRAELARCAGSQFDPDVVRAFLNVSLGRMRFVMGPLSWLAHAPLLGRLPLTPALGTAAGVISVVATSAAAGIAGPKTPVSTAAVTPPAVHRPAPVLAAKAPVPPVARVVVRRSASTAARPSPPAARPVPAVPRPPTETVAPTPPAPPQPTPAPPPGPATPPPPLPAQPAFTAGPDLVVREDGPSVSLPWASDLAGVTHFVTSTGSTAMFASAPSVSPDGRLSFALAPDAFGIADVAVSAVGDRGAGAGHTLRITVEPVNDPPSFVAGGDVTAVEDSGPHALVWASGISPGPANESDQHVRFDVTTDAPGLFALGAAPTVDALGRLSFTPAFLASGTATVTVTEIDDAGTANGGDDRTTRSFHIVVLPRNHAPHVTGAGDVSVPEDSPAQSEQWVTAVDPGAPGESGQTVTLTAASDHPQLFTAQPALSASGVLTYTPAPDAFGTATVTITAKDDGGTANGGDDTSTTVFTITLRPVNDQPSFTAGADPSVLENAGPQSVAWASAISAGPPNEAAQAVSFSTSTGDPALFTPAGQPTVAPDGVLTFTPAFGASGAATVTVTLHDDGGTANGGVDTSSPQTFTIAITAVNQQPTFTGGGDVTGAEDTPVSGLTWATAISAGPNESGQTLAFTVANDDNSLFSTQPSVDAAGRLSYAPAADANGSATVSVTLHDDGGTANGGVDTSSTVAFTLTITPVNDAPTFTAGGSVGVLEDSGVYGSTWATAISPGPDEAGQSVSFTVTNDAQPLFSVQPSVDASGTLRFAPAANAYGSATVTVVATDDGGTASGGVDTSATQTFTLTIAPVNDAPSFLPGGDVTSLEDAGAQDVAWATATSAGPNESSQHVAFVVTTTNSALFDAQPAIDATTGRLSFSAAPNANGTATVTVVATDDGGTANGGVDAGAPQTFTLTVTPVNDAPVIGPVAAQSANEDDGPQTVALTSFTAGPSDEAAQTLTVTTSVDHPEYFDVAGQPTVDDSGNLTYTPATGMYGTATVTLTVADSGGTANGGVDTASTSFTITLVPLPPIAGDDAYTTTFLTPLVVDAAHGVLANDADVNSATLTVTPQISSSGLLGGTLNLNADGSFTYQPLLSLTGRDQFTYTITNSNNQTATGTITIDVTASTGAAGTFYLQTSGLSTEVWSLDTAVPAPVSPVPDLDGDGNPGLTIAGGDGKETITDPKKQQAWVYETGAGSLSVHGPLTLELTAASEKFAIGKAETLWVYVYDCPGGSSTLSTTGCTLLGQNKVLVAKWNTVADYATHDAVVSVDRDFGPNEQLRIRLLVGGAPLWIPLVSPYQTRVDYVG
jgi:hypothetical protein